MVSQTQEEAMTYPDVRECRVERFETITAGCFCNDCNYSHEDPNEAVLEDSKVDDLRDC